MRGIEHIPWLYDGLMSLADSTGLKRWRHWLVRGARGRTLEIGCGTGRNLPLYPGGTQVIASDPDLGLLRVARRRAPTVPLVVGRAEALSFASSCFDTVVSSLAFCSVEDPQLGLREVRRVLRPDGHLRMLEHVRARRRFWARCQDAIQPAWTWLTGGCHPNRDTEAAVEAAGFRIDSQGRRAQRELRRFSAVVRE